MPGRVAYLARGVYYQKTMKAPLMAFTLIMAATQAHAFEKGFSMMLPLEWGTSITFTVTQLNDETDPAEVKRKEYDKLRKYDLSATKRPGGTQKGRISETTYDKLLHSLESQVRILRTRKQRTDECSTATFELLAGKDSFKAKFCGNEDPRGEQESAARAIFEKFSGYLSE